MDLVGSGERDCAAVLRQPKRLALLTYLGCHHVGHHHRRDSLLAMFWPELDQSHARASLRRAIHFLRQALGNEVIENRGDEELLVPASVMTTDLTAFRQAIKDGNYREALDLYRGDLLEGVYVDSAPLFEDWAEGERRHLRGMAAKAAWSQAEQLEPTDAEGAKAYAGRAVSLDPYDEAALRRQLALLDRLGDRVGAGRAFEDFATRYREEMDLEPSVESQNLITTIRSSGPRIQRLRARQPATAPRVVAIFPFVIRAPESLAYLREGMVDLLTTKLDGAGTLRGADPRVVLGATAGDAAAGGEIGIDQARQLAKGLEAQLFLLGSVVAAGDSIQLNASLYDASGKILHKAEAVGETETELFELVDLLARQLLASQSARPTRLDRISAYTSENLTALKAYLSGEQHFRAGHFFEAAEAFQRAVDQDPEFALAHHRLGSSWAACAVPELARSASHEAYHRRDRLSTHDRLLVEAQKAWLAGEADQAESIYAKVVERYPDDMEAWFLLGDLRFHHNPYRGRTIREALPAFRRAANLDPDHVNTLSHLARLAAMDGRRDELESLTQRIELLSPSAAPTLPIRALRAFAVEDVNGQADALEELKDARALTIGVAFSDVALYSGNVEGTDRFGREFLSVARSPELQAVCHLILAHLALRHGRVEEALRAVDEAESLSVGWAKEVRGLFAALPFVSLSAEARRAIATDLEQWDAASEPGANDLPLALHNGLHAHLRLYLLSLIAVTLDDVESAVEHTAALRELETRDHDRSFVAALIAGAEARIAWSKGETTEALALLEHSRPALWFQQAVASPFYAQAFERYMRAELLMAQGRERDAVGWFRSLVQRTPFELIYQPVVEQRLKEMSVEVLNDE